MSLFEIGSVYNRRKDIHSVYGGQQQGGISTPKSEPFIFLFTGQSGTSYGYEDGWTKDGLFGYTGEGQSGDMEFLRGNKAILEHASNGKDLLLFEILEKRQGVRFIGPFYCDRYETYQGLDVDGLTRESIRFLLAPLTKGSDSSETALNGPVETIQGLSLEDLRKRAYEALQPPKTTLVSHSQGTIHSRSQAVKNYVLARADGHCELTGEKAPFLTKSGKPYLEVHHTRKLSDGGPDHPRWVAAISPTAHREIHFGKNGDELNKRLMSILDEIEPTYDT